MRFIEQIAKNDVAVKLIFDNIRNLGLCAVVLGAGGWKAKHLGTGWLHYFDNGLAWFLILAGLLLMWLNIVNGLIKVKESSIPLWVKGVLGGLYAGLAAQVVFMLLEARFNA